MNQQFGPEVKNDAFSRLGSMVANGKLSVRKTEDEVSPTEEVVASPVEATPVASEATSDVVEAASPAVVSVAEPEVKAEAVQTAPVDTPVAPPPVEATPVTPTKEGRGKGERRRRRNRDTGGGIVVPHFTPAQQKKVHVEVERPRGTIALSEILNKDLNTTLLAHRIVSGRYAKDAKPDFVVFKRTKKGFDFLRVNVIVKESRKEGGAPFAVFAVAEATGSYAALAEHVGTEVSFGSLLRAQPARKESEEATRLLCEAIAEAAQALALAIDRKNTRA